jgi:hypothetical protein
VCVVGSGNPNVSHIAKRIESRSFEHAVFCGSHTATASSHPFLETREAHPDGEAARVETAAMFRHTTMMMMMMMIDDDEFDQEDSTEYE